MLCCLNPACQNPSVHDSTKYCPDCGAPLLILRNRYCPAKSLGGGGFAKTYLAEDVDKLREKCVIKQFAPQVQGTAGLQKATELFEQEARRLQQLGEHPQIPTLLAYFQEDSRLYLVQQFIDGQNLLDELQQQGTFSEGKIRDLLQDLLNILQVVHQQKVIHRDIKPENIIQRGDGKIVLIDFGASKQLTQTIVATQGTMIGSFGYAPLEQMQGGEAYPAGDLYGLGATCFHLLSGIHPWELWKRQGYGWVANWRENLQQPVSQELGQILDKLLHEDYQQRYGSAQEVLQALNPPPKPVPPTQPVIITPPSSPSVVPPTQLAISTPAPSPVPPTVPIQAQAIPAASIKPSAKTKIATKNLLTQNPKLTKRLLVGAAITLLGLVGSQIYGYVRYQGVLSNSFSERTLPVHSSLVRSVAISPDGKTLVSGGYKTIKLWNLETGKEIRTLTGHSGNVSSVAISPDGKTLVSGSEDKTIKLWNLETGKEIRTLTRDSDLVSSVTISPDGKTLVSGSADNNIKLWNLETGEEISTLTGHSDKVSSVAISPDGKTLVSGSYDKTIKLWNLETKKEIPTLTKKHSDSVSSVAISPDGKTLASSADNTIKLWNLLTGEKIHTFTGHSDLVSSVAISPDGKTLISGSWDKTIKLWNLETGKEIRTLAGHSDKVSSVTISPDGKTLVSGSWDETVKLWQLE
ncbi:protein kinase [Tolypothrix tenuis PCC 7101]|uniref:Protein kinase n=1 Tax=Tolypothrix tenuis PCC 7101 TaxID=231146 RepID=A0A1Z4MX35_9CYAN|nr:serine/threonine protein kinase [Aulosira sp. FACHB-113]BAY98045.1 protein kinase [Tolypothrix tenuis PCC 7101]BAZ78036.1 protein kinase [Aulosira laxa NIES-50]